MGTNVTSPADDEPERLSHFDRILMSAIGEGKVVGLDTDPARTQYPALWQWLSTTTIGKDKVKTPPTLTITLGPGGVLLSIRDNDLATSLDSSCAHLGDAFAALEKAIKDPSSLFKRWAKKEPTLRKRKTQN